MDKRIKYVDGFVIPVNAKVMKDPRIAPMADGKTLPFDGMRVVWGGFKPFVRA